MMKADALEKEGTAEQVLSNQKVRDVYLGEQFRL